MNIIAGECNKPTTTAAGGGSATAIASFHRGVPVWHPLEYVAPGGERLRIILVQLIAAAVDDLVIWQAELSTCWELALVQHI